MTLATDLVAPFQKAKPLSRGDDAPARRSRAGGPAFVGWAVIVVEIILAASAVIQLTHELEFENARTLTQLKVRAAYLEDQLNAGATAAASLARRADELVDLPRVVETCSSRGSVASDSAPNPTWVTSPLGVDVAVTPQAGLGDCPQAASLLDAIAGETALMRAAAAQAGITRLIVTTPLGVVTAPRLDENVPVASSAALASEQGAWRPLVRDGRVLSLSVNRTTADGANVRVEADVPESWLWRFTLPIEGAPGELMIISRTGDVLARGEEVFGALDPDSVDVAAPPSLDALNAAEGRVLTHDGERIAAMTLESGELRLAHVVRALAYLWHVASDNAGTLAAFILLGLTVLAGYVAARIFVIGPAQRAERALEQISLRLRAIFATVRDGVCLVNDAGTVVSANASMERLLGAAQLEGATLENLADVWAETAPDFADALRSLPDAGERGRTVAAPSGCTLLLRSAPVAGAPQVVVTATDFTERARMVDDLAAARTAAEAAARSKAAFLAAMSHEIRTPMNGVIGMVELLSGTRLDTDQRRLLRIVRESGLTLVRIINDILDFSKIEAGRLEIERLAFPLGYTVETAVMNLATAASAKSVRLITDIDPGLPADVVGDPVRVRQILVNLVGNAVKFSERSPVIVRVAAVPGAGDMVRFTVVDEGIGISEENQTKLFQEFSQAESDTTRRFGGTGLGLAICKRLTTMMGGEIGVVSAPAQGSQFHFTLPLPAASDAPALESEQPLADLTVLIAEGGPREVEACAAFVQRAGGRVVLLGPEDDARQFRHADAAAPADAVLMLTARSGRRDIAALLRRAGVATTTPVAVAHDPRTPREPLDSLETVTTFDVQPLCQSKVVGALAQAVGRAPLCFEEDETEVDAPAPPSVEQAEREGRLILVAEDNAVNQEVLAGLIARLGQACVVVDGGEQALAALRDQRFGLLLTDCHMPELDGFDLTRRIRETERCGEARRLPIVAVTAGALKEETDRCLAVGMDGVLTKPVAMADLRATLAAWLPAAVPAEPAPAPARASDTADDGGLDLSHLKAAFGDDATRIGRCLRRFLDTAPDVIADAERAIAASDVLSAGLAGHKLKSSARLIGAGPLAVASEEIELGASDGDPDRAAYWTKEARRRLDDACALIAGLGYPV